MMIIQNAKIKMQNYNSKFKIFYFLLVLLTFNFWFLTSTATAADSTQSADFIRSKCDADPACKKLLQDIASKAAQLKQFVDKKLKDKAYIGKVKTKSPTSITLATKNGPRIVNINQDTLFDSEIKGKKYQQKSISEEDYLVTLGDVDENGVLTAKKIILLQTPNSELKTYLWGQIVAISDKLVTIKDRSLKSIAISFSNPSDVKISDFVILTGTLGKNDIFESEFVYVIPQGGILKPKKVVYPAPNGAGATSSASPRAKPTSR